MAHTVPMKSGLTSTLPRMALRAALAFSLVLAGCGPEPPIRIGFIGGLSDRGADVGETGRNGVQLAVEQRNKAGGVGGRRIELVILDDGQDPQKAASAMRSLIDERVDAIIGPFTSAIAAAIVPLANEARVVMVSPTVTSGDFVGKDDFFVRINRTTRDNATDYAGQIFRHGQRRVAVAYDTGNRSFSESWLGEFRSAFAAAGGQVVAAVPFASQRDTGFGEIVRQMLAARPDGVLFIANAVDVARLSQQAVKQAPTLPRSAAEWATSDALIELGGRSVEGLLIAQSFDRDDTSPRYRAFRSGFLERFGREPGYSAINSHDAATVVIEAIGRRERGEVLKDAILRIRGFDGLQQRMEFDRFGDTRRAVYFSEIRDGRFVLIR